ncbi:hypothetical protein NPIL_664491 [Nephila pilipes]|uniref:Uncharacterized protein n=1 Tax=Nephila pilipes TaxID=299642 RepID=A0A8X6Q6T7_NEPPI|nr:hypothetical protein NPIL_664491 [Nephila pilipes]
MFETFNGNINSKKFTIVEVSKSERDVFILCGVFDEAVMKIENEVSYVKIHPLLRVSKPEGKKIMFVFSSHNPCSSWGGCEQLVESTQYDPY